MNTVSHEAAADSRRAWLKILARYKKPDRRRSTVELAITLIPFVTLWALSSAAYAYGHWWGLVLILPAAGFLVRIFMIQHDCGHGSFFANRAADDWIADNACPGVIVVTADIPLASRALEKGASVIAPNGRIHTASTIGNTLATRNLMDALRSAGETTGGPAPFSPKDRSAFLSALDLAINRLKRAGFEPG